MWVGKREIQVWYNGNLSSVFGHQNGLYRDTVRSPSLEMVKTQLNTKQSALAVPPVVMELGHWEVPARLSCSVVLPTVLILRL